MTGPMAVLKAKRAELLRKKREEDVIDKRIERLYHATCSGVQIDIMDIGKVFSVAKRCIAAHKELTGEELSDEDLAKDIRDYVQTIRKN